jgi:hypothetical protein
MANSVRLPVERIKLERLGRQPHQGIQVLPQIMGPEEAAQPSPQEAVESAP